MADHSDPTSNFENDDISSLLNILLHNSSHFSNSGNFSQRSYNSPHFTVAESPSCLNLPLERSRLTDSVRNCFTSSIHCSVEAVVDADSRSEDQDGVQVRRDAPGKSSSKRSRAAEVHNLSEKRRRQKINEKMKALQKLIPNSNKTDKASMLDDAIEYLKQLQLQVQTLTMRNGSTLHPFYMPGAAQPLHLPPTVPLFEEGNNSRIGTFLANQEDSTPAMFDLHLTRIPENSNSRTAYLQEPSTTAHYRPSFNTNMLSKVLCKDSLLKTNRCGQSSSSGISS